LEGLAGALKLAADFGGLGALVVAMWLMYRLIDRWGGAFLKTAETQAAAVASQASAVLMLVDTVKQSQKSQEDVVMAVRILSDRIERQGKYLEGIESYVMKDWANGK
jgi:hypothetical protein